MAFSTQMKLTIICNNKSMARHRQLRAEQFNKSSRSK